MAAKRPTKTTPRATPQAAAAASDAAIKAGAAMIQRGPGGRFVAPATTFVPAKELKVELRAEREPAVTVADDVVAKAAAAELLPPAPRQLSPLQRLWGWLRRDKAEKAEMAAHMAAVKAGVLQELEAIGAKKGIALKGSPFASVVLPVRPKPRPRRWLWAVALLVLGVGLVVWMGNRKDSPNATLAALSRAVAAQDARRFEQLVDLPAVAVSVVNQMFSLPPKDALAVHAALLVKPGMALDLQRDILAAVAGDNNRGETLPLRLYDLLGGEKLEAGRAQVRMQDVQQAVAEVPLMRKDLALTLPLKVVLERRNERWMVVDVPNLVQVLSRMVEAEQTAGQQAAEGRALADSLRTVLEAGAVEVERLAKPESLGANMLLRARVANHSAGRVRDAQLEVVFGDAAQRPLLTLKLPLEGTMLPDEVREQVWSVPVDMNEPHAATVARLPLGALSVTATVVY